ncbi:HNH/endonuclease VII fold putative polymorphic toxin [Streptomyces sp. NPDC005907]|uniref:HNH/endonuclease VII fold putative polymorphic toxin n=1 Tax=Streptomyces sp. NPDC005907 TaxID=3154571 RepID=UPI0033F7ADD2
MSGHGDKHLKHTPGYICSPDPAHWGNFRQFETDSGSRVVVEHTNDPAGPHFHAVGWDNARVQRAR